MNEVHLVGRLTKKPEVRYNTNNTAICRFNIAIDRPKSKDKEESETDYPTCVCFNNLAVNLVKYQDKGGLIAVSGRLQTGSYEKEDGTKVYTTEVMVNRIQFLSSKISRSDMQNQDNSADNAESNAENDLSKFQQVSASTVMNEDYNPELAIQDSDLPF